MALSKDVVIRLLGDASSAEKALRAAADAAEVNVKVYKRLEQQVARQAAAQVKADRERQATMEAAGKNAMIFGAVVAAGLAMSTKAAVDWESAWAGVTKVTDGTPQQMQDLESSLRGLATQLPATHKEIAGVAEAAGQLGVARGDIVEFTKVAIAMGVSTNLASEDAATGMARFSNIMGTPIKDVDRLGSVIVGLGNAGASTESEILTMGLRIAAAGKQANMTEGDVLGIANAMSSMGIEAEAGGTAISTVIKKINSAVIDGGDELTTYAQLAGMSAEQFAKAWRDDAAGALTLVTAGLGNIQHAGGNVNTVLDDLGLNDIRVSDTMLRLSNNSKLLSDSLDTGNKAWSENSALMNEANKRYETTASKVQIAQNTLDDAAITIGETLLPVLAAGADIVADFARGWGELPGWMQESVVIIGAVVAGVALLGGGLTVAVPKIIAFRTEMAALSASSSLTQRAVGGLGTFMTGPWGLAMAGASLGIGVLVGWLGKQSKASESAQSYTRDLASALRESKGAIDANVRALASQKAADEEIGDSNLLEMADKAGVKLPHLTDALLGNRDAYEEVRAAMQKYADARVAVDDQGNAFVDKDAQAMLDSISHLDDLTGSMGGAVAENERLAKATAESGDAAEGSTPQLAGAAGAMGEMHEEGQGAADAAEALAKAIGNLNGPTLDVREATRRYKAALDDVQAALAENGRTLDINTEAGRNNSEALDSVAKSAAEQANAIYANTGSYDAFRTSLESARQSLFDQARQFFDTDEEAQAYVDTVLRIPDEAATGLELTNYDPTRDQLIDVFNRVRDIPPEKTVNVPALTEDAEQKLSNLGFTVNHLPDGTVDVTANTQQAKDDLDALTVARSTVITAYIDAVQRRGGGMAGSYPERAVGGAIQPGAYLVGEKGPEIVEFGAHGFVTPADLSRQALDAAKAGAGRALASASAAPGIPVGSHYGGGMVPTSVAIDEATLMRLAAAVADRRPTVHVDHWETAEGETPLEVGEAMNWTAATRGTRG